MLAKASDQPTHASQAHRFREQARSHRGFVLGKELVNTFNHCGSGLAREGVGSAIHASQAHRFREQARSHRGFVLDVGIGEHLQSLWERACSRRRRVSQHMRHRPTAFASKPAPTGDLCWTWELVNTINHCGSGLAREGVGSANTCFTGPPLSRASPLPQGICAGQGICEHLQSLWERACSLPQGICAGHGNP